MLNGWQRFAQRKVFRSAVVSWFRGLEVTRNNDKRSKWKGTCHPHFQVLICVKPHYFTGTGYLKQKDWQGLW